MKKERSITEKIIYSEKVPFLFILLGIIFRLKHFLENRSLWLDEAWVAIKLSAQTFHQILNGVPFIGKGSFTPIGFLLVEKSLITLFRNNEYVLRLFPFVCGVLSVLLFYFFVKRFFKKQILLLSLGLFVFSDRLIYYSAELKPYSVDVFLCLCLLFCAFEIFERQKCHLWLFVLNLCGAVCVWISFPAVFVLMSVNFSIILWAFFKKKYSQAFYMSVTNVAWVSSLLFLYFYAIKKSILASNVPGMWGHAFVPLSEGPISCILWTKASLLETLSFVIGNPSPVLGVFFLMGIFSLLRFNRHITGAFVVTIFFVFLAACLKKYPFYQRLILFIAPIFIIFIAEGATFLIGAVHKKYKALTGWLIVLLLLFYPIKTSFSMLFKSWEKEDNRAAMKILHEKILPTDTLYMNNSAHFMYSYYMNQFEKKNFQTLFILFLDDIGDSPDVLRTSSEYVKLFFNKEGYPDQVCYGEKAQKTLKVSAAEFENNKRSWLLLSHFGEEQKKLLIQAFNKKGNMLYNKNFIGTSVYLFDFNKN